jgi:protein SCO1
MRTDWKNTGVTLVLATVFGVGGVAADCRAETEETAERVVQDEPLPELPIAATAENRQPTGTVSDRIPNVVLTTHEGKPIRFYDDVVKGNRIGVNFMYTVCKGICPGMTTNILKVREQMAEKGFTDFTFVSISLEPEVDNPEQLRNYMKAYEIENKPGLPKWIFLTGKIEDVDAIRRALGAYDLDEEVDADITQHGGMITYGNDRTGWWNAVAALMEPKLITPAIMRLTNDALPPLPSRAGVVKESIIPELSRRGLLVE